MAMNLDRTRTLAAGAALSMTILVLAGSHAATATQVVGRVAATFSQGETKQATVTPGAAHHYAAHHYGLNVAPGAAHHYALTGYATTHASAEAGRSSIIKVGYDPEDFSPGAAHHYP